MVPWDVVSYMEEGEEVCWFKKLDHGLADPVARAMEEAEPDMQALTATKTLAIRDLFCLKYFLFNFQTNVSPILICKQ